MAEKVSPPNNALPKMFEPILWSYDFPTIDPVRHRKTIITNAFRYGTMKHIRWVVRRYGKENVREILSSLPESELPSQTRRLSRVLLGITHYDNTHRGTH